MKIYTKTGDKGTTALFGGTRVPKHHIRIESYGTVDELNSYIGLIKDQKIEQEHQDSFVRSLIADKLRGINIPVANIEKQINFDTEEACEAEHNGNWAKRFLSQ